MSSIPEPEQWRKLFVGGLNYRTTEDGLRSFYSQWGEIADCVVMTERDTGRSRGFGFVTYCEAAMVDAAMNSRPHTIDGRQVQPKRAVAREEASSPGANTSVSKVFIGGIRDKPITRDDLMDYFSQFGEIRDCVIMTDKVTGNPRGFAFVQFDDYDPVDKIVLKKYHTVKGVNIDVKKAIPKDSIYAPQPRNRGVGSGRSSVYHPYGRRGGQSYSGRMNSSFSNDGNGSQGFGAYRSGMGSGSVSGNSVNSGNSAHGAANVTFHGYDGDYGSDGFDVYGSGPSNTHGTQANTAYGFGGWGGASGGGDFKPSGCGSDVEVVGYPTFGQHYGQSRGGGPIRGDGAYKSSHPADDRHSDAGVIGSGRPAPYSGGVGGRSS